MQHRHIWKLLEAAATISLNAQYSHPQSQWEIADCSLTPRTFAALLLFAVFTPWTLLVVLELALDFLGVLLTERDFLRLNKAAGNHDQIENLH